TCGGMRPRDLARNAIALFEEGASSQALALVRAQEDGFRALVIAELLRDDYRAAPVALLVCALDARRAHPYAVQRRRGPRPERLEAAVHIPAAPRATARSSLALLSEAEVMAGPGLREASVALAKTASGKAAARAFRLQAKLEEEDAGDYEAWAPRLVKVLDVAAFDELGASRGRALMELERLCTELLAER
ncbi:MAG: hypothetical protein AAGH15_24735, partial [Myxococcota bacterium]